MIAKHPPNGRGMVVAPQPEAVERGVQALRAGGKAVDAALACAFMQTATDPSILGMASHLLAIGQRVAAPDA